MVHSIELPDSLEQQLEDFASSADMPLPAFILKILSPFAEIALLLKNEDPLVRIQALRRLDTLDQETVTPILVKALQDNNLIVRSTAADMLKKFGPLTGSTDTGPIDLEPNLLPNEEKPKPTLSLFDLAGTLDIGTTDLGERHDYYIAQALERELLPDE